MKPFNLEEALTGAPVVTRRGGAVTDFYLFKSAQSDTYPLAGVLDGVVRHFTVEGAYVRGDGHPFDLFMAPTKKQGWVNLYRSKDPVFPDCMADCQHVWATRESALEGACAGVIATVMIEWEE